MALTQEQIKALRAAQYDLRATITEMARQVGVSSRDTLSRALRGRPIWIVDHQRVIAWLDDREKKENYIPNSRK